MNDLGMMLTSKVQIENGEHVSLIGCCNAVGTFLSLVLYLKKEKRKYCLFSRIYSRKQNKHDLKIFLYDSRSFFNWLKDHFTIRKLCNL